MPAKIVYGKKKKALHQPHALCFEGFLSPRQGAKRNDLGMLEGEEGGKGERKGAQKVERVRQVAAAIEEELERSMARLAIGANMQEKSGLEREKKPRKALVVRDRNTVLEGEEKKTGGKKAKEKEKVVVDMVSAASTSHSGHEPKVCTPRRTPKRTPKATRGVERTPPSRPGPAQLPTPDATPEPEDIYSVYVSPLLALSDRQTLVTFEEWAKELEPYFEMTKIAEASFSEVYRLSAMSPTPDGTKAESVLKVVALKTPPAAPYPCQSSTRAIRDHDGQLQKETEEREEKDRYKSHVADVLSEVRLLQNLNHIPGFTVFRDLSLVRGRPSPAFNTAWSSWNKARPRGKKSEFPDPAKKNSYDDSQLWAIIEMQDAGTDCEKLMEAGGLASIWEVWDVFWGVACSMAKAEEGVRFEHRDLHLGNICVRGGPGVKALRVKHLLKRKMRFTGLETTVIDYTLSRADILDTSCRQRQPSASADVAFLDLDVDPALFQGDASEEYQYEIYRYMRGAALFGNPLQWEAAPPVSPTQTKSKTKSAIDPPPPTPRRSPRKNTHIRFDDDDDGNDTTPPESTTALVSPRRSPRKHSPSPSHTPPLPTPQDSTTTSTTITWRAFHPLTNLVWLHFLLHKLLTHLGAHATLPSTLSAAALAQQSPVAIEEATHSDAQQLIKKKALRLEKILRRVADMLCPVELGREAALGSVKELVVLGLEERWLGLGDVEA